MKSLSLCITCWNKDIHFLADTLENIGNQTVKPDEVVIVANNVEKIEIPNKFFDVFKNIKTHFIRIRKPVSWSRNKCAEISNCDIVTFFDIDDIPHQQKIEITKLVFENDNVDCFVHGFNENKETSEKYTDFSVEKITELIPPQGYLKIPSGDNKDLHHGHLSAKREVILKNPYNENLGFYEHGFQYWGEDTEICKRLFSLGYNFYYSKNKLINYRPSYVDNSRSWYSV